MDKTTAQMATFSIANGRQGIKKKDVKTLFMMLEEVQKQNNEILSILKDKKAEKDNGNSNKEIR